MGGNFWKDGVEPRIRGLGASNRSLGLDEFPVGDRKIPGLIRDQLGYQSGWLQDQQMRRTLKELEEMG